MLEELKEKVFKANLDLVKQGLVIFTPTRPHTLSSIKLSPISKVWFTPTLPMLQLLHRLVVISPTSAPHMLITSIRISPAHVI